MPRLTEGPTRNEYGHHRSRRNVFVARRGPGVSGQLGQGLIILFAPTTRRTAQLVVSQNAIVVLLEDSLVSESDIFQALGLQVAQAFGDVRIHLQTLVGQGGRDDFGSFRFKLRILKVTQASQRTGDGRVVINHQRTIHFALLGELKFLL